VAWWPGCASTSGTWQVIGAAALIGSQVDQDLLAAVVERRRAVGRSRRVTRSGVMKPFGKRRLAFRTSCSEVARSCPPSTRKRLQTGSARTVVSTAATAQPNGPLVSHHFELGANRSTRRRGEGSEGRRRRRPPWCHHEAQSL
jgi:hypothetical protein